MTMRTPTILAIVAIATSLVVVSLFHVSDAEACVPPMYEMYHAEIIDEDTPECVELHEFPQHHYDGDSLDVAITNDCDEDLEIHILDCPTLDDAAVAQSEDFTCNGLIVGSGATERLVLEARPTYELEHGESQEQVYSWHLGVDEGILHTQYEYDDPYAEEDFADEDSYSGGCAMVEEDPYMLGCSTAGASLPMDIVILLAIATGALTVRRRWSAASCVELDA